jgi:hypothetical protein
MGVELEWSLSDFKESFGKVCNAKDYFICMLDNCDVSNWI